jgi:hypothetical protein
MTSKNKTMHIDIKPILVEINKIVHTHIRQSVLEFNTCIIQDDIDEYSKKTQCLEEDLTQLQTKISLGGSRIQQSTLQFNVSLVQQDIESHREKIKSRQEDMHQLFLDDESLGTPSSTHNIVLDIQEMTDRKVVSNPEVGSETTSEHLGGKMNTVLVRGQSTQSYVLNNDDGIDDLIDEVEDEEEEEEEEVEEEDKLDDDEFKCEVCSTIQGVNTCDLCDTKNVCVKCYGEEGDCRPNEIGFRVRPTCLKCSPNFDFTIIPTREEVKEEDVESIEEEEDEEEEGVFEIDVDGVSYYTTGEENGTLYSIDVNGDPDKFVGRLQNGKVVLGSE